MWLKWRFVSGRPEWQRLRTSREQSHRWRHARGIFCQVFILPTYFDDDCPKKLDRFTKAEPFPYLLNGPCFWNNRLKNSIFEPQVAGWSVANGDLLRRPAVRVPRHDQLRPGSRRCSSQPSTSENNKRPTTSSGTISSRQTRWLFFWTVFIDGILKS